MSLSRDIITCPRCDRCARQKSRGKITPETLHLVSHLVSPEREERSYSRDAHSVAIAKRTIRSASAGTFRVLKRARGIIYSRRVSPKLRNLVCPRNASTRACRGFARARRRRLARRKAKPEPRTLTTGCVPGEDGGEKRDEKRARPYPASRRGIYYADYSRG